MLCWARIWLCSACWAGLGADLAGRAGLVGRAGWVGRGMWPCWARLWCLAVLGPLRWVGRARLGADWAVCVWSIVFISS